MLEASPQEGKGCGTERNMECVRLSIHPHPNAVKFGVDLVSGYAGTAGGWPVRQLSPALLLSVVLRRCTS